MFNTSLPIQPLLIGIDVGMVAVGCHTAVANQTQTQGNQEWLTSRNLKLCARQRSFFLGTSFLFRYSQKVTYQCLLRFRIHDCVVGILLAGI